MLHPTWCWRPMCDAAAGGAHRSRRRAVSDLVTVELVEPVDGPSYLRVFSAGDEVLSIALDQARMFYRAVRDLERAGAVHA